MTDAAVVDLTDTPPRRSWWWLVGVWIAGTVAYAAALHLEKARLPFSIAFSQAGKFTGILAFVMALVAGWDRRATHRATRAWRAAASEILVGMAAIALWSGLRLLDVRLEAGPGYWRIYADTWLFQLLFDVAVYAAVRGLMLTAAGWRRGRDRERREAASVVAARDLELSVIRTQFQPHFVLNALNSLLALIDDDPALARTMVVRLADLMTAVFDRGDVQTVPLERELDLLRAYLDVERIRLGDRLSVRFDVDDAARGVPVPPFLLQPIVENAVKHGIAPFTGPGLVTVEAHVRDDRLHVAVSDSGGGLRMSTPATTGRGLQITRRRLDTAYGERYELTIDHGATGTTAHVDVPADEPRVA